MVWIIRLLLMLTAPVAAFFVGHDALNFGLVETLIAMIFISIFVVWIAWSFRRQKI